MATESDQSDKVDIEWQENFSVGVQVLDLEHRQILSLINLIYKNEAEGVKSTFVSDCLDLLSRYSTQHFQNEEEFLRKLNDPGLSDHIKQHRAYRKKVAELCIRTMNKEASVPHELLNYITKWWNLHILHDDQVIRELLEERKTN